MYLEKYSKLALFNLRGRHLYKYFYYIDNITVTQRGNTNCEDSNNSFTIYITNRNLSPSKWVKNSNRIL